MESVLELAKKLIARPSLTPDDAGCQTLIAERLKHLGFRVEPMRFGKVDNLWARRGDRSPLLVFAGHTDVVPTGPLDQWHSNPFSPEVRDGYLYGRGAADMKGGLAAMLVAVEQCLRGEPTLAGSLAFLITSDEEGPAVDGTVRVIEVLRSRNEAIDWCILGEPSCQTTFGDTIRNGRRGSLSGILKVQGVQGHVAYPDRAENPIHKLVPALADLLATDWATDDENFPPAGFQVSNFHSGTGAGNVIPGEAEIRFNFRYPPSLSAEEIRQRVQAILDSHALRYEIDWQSSGTPFLTEPGELSRTVQDAVEKVTGVRPRLDTGGGTSDGRFFAPSGAQVVEFGPVSSTIHKIDERVAVSELEQLTDIYARIIRKLLVR